MWLDWRDSCGGWRDGYLPNPYHNKTHAADVLQSQYMLLTAGGLARRAADPLILLAALLSAIIHDLDHKGVNNDFLIRQSHELAIVYNGASGWPWQLSRADFALGETAPLATITWLVTSVQLLQLQLAVTAIAPELDPESSNSSFPVHWDWDIMARFPASRKIHIGHDCSNAERKLSTMWIQGWYAKMSSCGDCKKNTSALSLTA